MSVDIHYATNVLVMHCNGPGFIDDSPVGSTLTVVAGTPVISTADSLFGGASLYMDGNSVLAVPHASGVNTLGDTFSIEFCINLDNTKTTQNIFDARDTGSATDWVIYAQDDGSGTLYNMWIYDGSAAYQWPTAVAYHTKQRFGIFSNGGAAKLFTNGIVDSGTFTTSLDGSTSHDMWIGGVEDIGLYAFRGYLDEIRFNGTVCRYTDSYTLDIEEFPNSGPTGIAIDWGTRVITVYQAGLTALGGGRYQFDVNAFRLALKELEDSEEGQAFPDTHRHATQSTLAGVTYARQVEIINGYTVTFESTGTPYQVECIGANHNISDVKNVNDVSLIVGNSAGLISVNTSGGAGGMTTDQANMLARIEKLLRNKQITNPATGKLTVYDDDSATVLLEGDLYENAAGTQAYRGQGAERRERLA